ncbi:MAG: Gfo/Idh/MocA family oxidoreductase [Limnothrix sp. BL-A-16]
MRPALARPSHHPIRVGAIGVGNMGQHHARILSLLKDAELVGISDLNVERGLELASKYRVRFFEDYKDMLPLVDAVCIAVPTKLHYTVGMDCLRAGVHVLMEKPIAASIIEAEALVNAAAERQCILLVGHIERFNPTFQECFNVLKTERVLALEAHRMSPHADRANDVSVVLDLMIHDIDLILEIANSSVVRLSASGSRAASGQLDYVTATLGFANGIVATLTASKVTHRKIRRIAAHCQDSLVEADFLARQILVHRKTSSYPAGDRAGQACYRLDGSIESVAIGNTEPLHAELEHFVNCVRGEMQPSIGGEQALKALKIASAIEQMALDEPLGKGDDRWG